MTNATATSSGGSVMCRDGALTGRRRRLFGWVDAGAGELHGRRREALDPAEGDAPLARVVGIVLGVDDDDLAGAELFGEDALRQRVLDEALDRAPQWTSPEGGVVAPLGQEHLRRLRDLQPEALTFELR